MNSLHARIILRRRSLCLAAAVGASLQAFLLQSSEAVSIYDHYISTGDNQFVGTMLPIDSPAAIGAAFDMMKDLYGTRRIYWRGMQETQYYEGDVRPENVVIYKNIENSRNLIENQNINQVAIQAAHARGMELWGVNALYDWGVKARDPIFYSYPGEHEHYIRADNPEWVPVDKHGVRRQGGNIELAYPGARQAMVNWHVDQFNTQGYDGVLFHTYNENFTMRFQDEFGFNDPIVSEYKARYGVDIRRENFDRQKWYDLRGEYTTQFLAELKSALGENKGVGMAVTAFTGYIDKPHHWIGTDFSVAGNMTMDWEQWAQDGSVDSLTIWGSNPNHYFTVKNSVGTLGVETSLLTSELYHPPLQVVADAGGPMVGAYNHDEDYLLRSNIPVQPLSALSTSPDQYKRMRVLAQIIKGETVATAGDVTPLLTHSNLIMRRLALKALAKIKDPSTIPLQEAMLMDPEHGIRTAAVYSLVDNGRPESVQPILDAVEQYGNAPLMEGAVLALRKIPSAFPILENAVNTSTSVNVRSLAMRAIAMNNSTVPASMLPTFIAKMNDPEAYVRYFAVDAVGRMQANITAVNTLINTTKSPDPILSTHAAVNLKNMLRALDNVAAANRPAIIDSMDALFESYGDNSNRPEADWAFVPVGNALLDLVPDGATRLRQNMNQRTDRQTSLNAWNLIHLRQKPAEFMTVTEAQDAYAHFKMPRWDNVHAAKDNFDLKPANSQIHNTPGETGQTWQVIQGTVSDQIVQSDVNNGGNALKTVRRVGQAHEIRLGGDTWDAQAAELTRVTAKADWYRASASHGTSFALDVGTGVEAQILIDDNSFYRVWQTDGTASGGQYLQTNVKAGVNGWETVELVANWSLATGTTLTGTYDVYVTRDGDSSLGGMGRTLIANDVPIHSVAEQTLQQLVISNQPNASTDVITYWDNASLNIGPGGLSPFPMMLDINGGGSADAHPTAASFTSWNHLPSNTTGAENGYGETASVSRQVWTSGVNSDSVIATISSVDVASGTYNLDKPILNSRDATVPGREFNGSGSFTPSKDSVYRDHVVAEVGTNTVNNGTNHRMELKLEGLDADTTYAVKVYAYDNLNPRGINVFTDVTADPASDLPTGLSTNGSFTPGEGAAGTQWAPAGQYIDGSAMPIFPASDDFRALTLYLKSDANGEIVLNGTTVLGVTGVTQTLPVLNGFEINHATNTWSGASSTDWNLAANWAEGVVPNGKGRNATFAGAGGTVSIASPVTVGFINFTGSNYTLSGETVTLDDNSANSSVSGAFTGRAAIHVGASSSNNQTITAPLILAKDATVDVLEPAQSLTISNLQTSNAWLRKSGAGALTVNTLRTTGVAIDSGKVSILAGRSMAGTSRTTALNIAEGATLDLSDQDLVIDYLVGSPLNDVRDLIAVAYGSGSWTGSGLTSTAAGLAAGSLHRTALGYGDASTLGIEDSFSGQSFDGAALLVRYTYSGDATLDGRVDTADFNQLAGGYGTGTVWTSGDFNYDGEVDSIDFSLFLSNYGMSMPLSASASGAAVPEPASMSLLTAAAALLHRRRRAATMTIQ